MTRNKHAAKKTLVADAREAGEHCIGMNVRRAAREISKFFDARLAQAGLSLAQFGLLINIAGAQDDTIGALAERSGLDQSTLSRNLRHLENAGLIEIVAIEADLRRRAVWLTEQGASQLEEALPAWQRAQKDLSTVIAPKLIRVLAGKARTLS